MKVKELNKKIFHNCSQINREDYLQMLVFCYQKTLNASTNREQRLDTCMSKWKNTYNYLDS